MRDRASGVHPDILEHLPPKKNRSLPTVLLYALTCDFTGGCPPPPSRSLCQRVNLLYGYVSLELINKTLPYDRLIFISLLSDPENI